MDILFRQSIKFTPIICRAGSRLLFNSAKIALNKKPIKQEQGALIFKRRTYGNEQNQLNSNSTGLDSGTFEKISSDTLEALSDYFDQIIESTPHLKNADTNFSDGVLTIQFGQPYGTYVINRQSPNKQIWLSSPTSGPKRYDFVLLTPGPMPTGYWVYKHNQETLHELLEKEMIEIVKQEKMDFLKLPFGRKKY